MARRKRSSSSRFILLASAPSPMFPYGGMGSDDCWGAFSPPGVSLVLTSSHVETASMCFREACEA
jgi:hypothetical protein